MSIQIVGDADGIKLWNMMASSDDKTEQEYFNLLNNAAAKYGKVWFSDSVTQKLTRKNQTMWKMEWNNNDSQWEVSLFHIPEGVKKVNERISSFGKDPIEEIEIELDLEDILVEEQL